MRRPDFNRRVAVTGVGVMSPIGLDPETYWKNLVDGVSGLHEITRWDPTPYEAKWAGEIQDFNPADYMDFKAARRTDRNVHFGVAAAKQALADSGLVVDESNRDDLGVIFGSGAGGPYLLVGNMLTWEEKGPRSVSPFFIANMLPDTASGQIAIETGIRGSNMCIVTGLLDRHAQHRRSGRGHPSRRLHRGPCGLDREPAPRARLHRLHEHARDGHAARRRADRHRVTAVRPDAQRLRARRGSGRDDARGPRVRQGARREASTPRSSGTARRPTHGT